MSRSPGTIRASYKKFDRYLARNYPRLRVLHLPATILFSLIMSNIAALHGQLTPGTPGNLNNTSGITAIWFLVCCLVAMCWLVLQWRERSDLPAGCKAKFAWSTIPNALCLGLIFLPVTIYNEQNASAIREFMPLQPVLRAYEELDNRFPPPGRYTSGEHTHRGPHLNRYNAKSLNATWCEKNIHKCLNEGFRASFSFGPEAAWCSVETDFFARQTIDNIYGAQNMSDVCSGLPPAPFDIAIESWDELGDIRLRERVSNMEINMARLYAAHNASWPGHYGIGPFSGHVGQLSLIIFVSLFASLVSVFSIIELRIMGIICGASVGFLAFVLMFHRSFSIDNAVVSIWMRLSCIAVSLIALAFLGLTRNRTWRADLLCMTAVMSTPLLLTIWWMLTPLAFYATQIYTNISGFTVTIAQGWAAATLLLSLLLSPLTMALLDRYRNLPKA